jgi:hypothetical protein
MRVHIGKSSFGWRFSLHVDPEGKEWIPSGQNSPEREENLKIRDLDDWQFLWGERNSAIVDEYGEVLTVEGMLSIITDRRPGRYCHADAEPARHEIDHKHCIGHGSGPWDLIIGTFS